jgi:hypothetical protein
VEGADRFAARVKDTGPPEELGGELEPLAGRPAQIDAEQATAIV